MRCYTLALINACNGSQKPQRLFYTWTLVSSWNIAPGGMPISTPELRLRWSKLMPTTVPVLVLLAPERLPPLVNEPCDLLTLLMSIATAEGTMASCSTFLGLALAQQSSSTSAIWAIWATSTAAVGIPDSTTAEAEPLPDSTTVQKYTSSILAGECFGAVHSSSNFGVRPLIEALVGTCARNLCASSVLRKIIRASAGFLLRIMRTSSDGTPTVFSQKVLRIGQVTPSDRLYA
mmetsp:Transcript_128794/g.191985  ORF Transcript_128794/g.191985 Transcript_128794/m.191985 type:complete len:233 (-) Transcript_128794:302-1000(-)